MADDDATPKQEKLESDVRDMNLKEEDSDVDMDTVPDGAAAAVKRSTSPDGGAADTPASTKRSSRSPVKMQSTSQSPMPKAEGDVVGGEVSLKLEPGKPPKLSRSTSHKVERRAPQLFLEYADATSEATKSFQVLPECHYANKYMGITDPALECDCAEEWGKWQPQPLSLIVKCSRPTNTE